MVFIPVNFLIQEKKNLNMLNVLQVTFLKY